MNLTPSEKKILADLLVNGDNVAGNISENTGVTPNYVSRLLSESDECRKRCTMATKSIDIEDLVPAQAFSLVTLVQFGIVSLTAYGSFDLAQSMSLGGFNVSYAFIIAIVSLGAIAVTNELDLEDLKAWDDSARRSSSLDDTYQWTLLGTVGITVGVEFIPQINNLVTGSDIIGTVAFAICVVGVWAVVWLK